MAQSKAAKSLERVQSLTLDMEVPLRDAMQYVVALRMMADGLIQQDRDEGEAVSAVACAALDRLEALKALWDKTFKAAGK
jgi:hypothetical protein